jgi:hypothetical protein
MQAVASLYTYYAIADPTFQYEGAVYHCETVVL